MVEGLMRIMQRYSLIVGVCLGLLLGFGGCSKEDDASAPSATPPTPQTAANQLQQAFTAAPPEVKTTVETASQAMRTANYEQAIQSIQTIKAKQNLTVEQGMVIYNTERSLEASLINGVNAGDPNAKRAYEMLKRSHRN